MILQALYRLAEQEELLGDPDYEPKPVAWLVRVDQGGRLLGIEGTRAVADPDSKRSRPQPKTFLVPRQPTRTSGDRAFFLCDKAEYTLGLDPQPDEAKRRPVEKVAARFALFREEIEACAAATGDEGIRAVLTVLEDIAAGKKAVTCPEECEPNDLFAFVYAPDIDRCVHDRPAVRAYWKSKRADSAGQTAERQCLITGEMFAGEHLFPMVKKVPGGTPRGVSLVSFNANAFESYGWKSNANAPISRNAAEAAATALNRLLHPAYPDPRPGQQGQTLPRRHFRISADTVVCFWSSGQRSNEFLDVFTAVLEVSDPERVGDLYRSLWKGRPIHLDDPASFYALTLTGTQGRAIVRDWFETSVAEVADNLAQHFADLEIARMTPPPRGKALPPHIPLRALLGALAPFGKSEEIPAPLAARFIRAALRGRGTPYPIGILQRALERTRAEIGRTDWADLERRDARAALIKAVLLRNTSHKEITTMLDPTNTDPGYLLGRLMAVLERLQQVALGDVNASVVDRYFGAASATPRAVFTRLLKNARHHARKAKDSVEPRVAGTARWLEGLMDEIAFPFDPEKNGFPAHLDLEQQGLFVLGYHHQRHWLWLSREERERLGAEPPEPVAATS